jgi:hypothetical protein
MADTSPVTRGLLPAGKRTGVKLQASGTNCTVERVQLSYVSSNPQSLPEHAADHVVLGPAARLSAGVGTWPAAAVAAVLSGGVSVELL